MGSQSQAAESASTQSGAHSAPSSDLRGTRRRPGAAKASRRTGARRVVVSWRFWRRAIRPKRMSSRRKFWILPRPLARAGPGRGGRAAGSCVASRGVNLGSPWRRRPPRGSKWSV